MARSRVVGNVTRGGASGKGSTPKKTRTTVEATRPSAEERLKELESIVSDDDGDAFDLDPVIAPLEAVTVPAAAGKRFADLPEELPRAIPFISEPAYRAFAANVPGDYGFDPLGLCTDVTKFVQYREAELKHGRLAMLAALAWPLAEIAEFDLNEEFSESRGIPDLLAESGGRVLPQITGGAGDQFVETFVALVLLIGAAFELSAKKKSAEPGDLGFDPVGLIDWTPWPFVRSFIPTRRSWMKEAEVEHCRAAMIAVAYDILDEAITGNPVIEDTEYIFHRLDNKLLTLEYWGSAAEPEMLDAFPEVL